MEKTKTAVDYLLDALKHHGKQIPNPIAEKAKEMEKQQIIKAVNYAANEEPELGEEYYNETYGNENT